MLNKTKKFEAPEIKVVELERIDIIETSSVEKKYEQDAPVGPYVVFK